jgi:hypothetical protein
MEFLIYLLVLVLSFLGLAIGIILSYQTKEEIPYGKRYFKLAKLFLIIIIFGSLFYFASQFNFRIMIVFLVMIFLITLFREYIKYDSQIEYALLSMAFFLSSFNKTVFMLNASLIFLYGFLEAGLFFINTRNKKENLKLSIFNIVFKEHIHFFILSLLWYGLYIFINIF